MATHSGVNRPSLRVVPAEERPALMNPQFHNGRIDGMTFKDWIRSKTAEAKEYYGFVLLEKEGGACTRHPDRQLEITDENARLKYGCELCYQELEKVQAYWERVWHDKKMKQAIEADDRKRNRYKSLRDA